MGLFRGHASKASDPPAVTLLHVSDVQFGPNHRFTKGVDSLSSRLLVALRDLQTMVPPIDVVVLSGDAAETGRASEFAMAAAFLKEVRSALGLNADRVVLVPGNHDINRHSCKAYVESELANEREPAEPYAPKWDQYLTFLADVYGEPQTGTTRLHRFEQLGLTVAALDSTMAETHEVHIGSCGEEQLRRFGDELAAIENGFRVAIVHHNVRREAENVEENLRDADDFTRLLGPHLDLVLHGHTHNGRQDCLSDGTLVLSTGSAALEKEQRPDEMPNQFQVISLQGNSVSRWARCYEPNTKRWIADARFGSNASPGFERIVIPGRLPVEGDAEPAPPEPVEPPPVEMPAPASKRPREGARLPADFLAAIAVEQEIDYVAVRKFCEDVRKDAGSFTDPGLSLQETLDRLGLMRDGRPTRAAVLLFGVRPQVEFPGGYVKCVRYHGVDRVAERHSQQLTGTARAQADAAHDFVKERVLRYERPDDGGMRATVRFSYPMTCVREVIVNAIVHRDYADPTRNIHLRLFDDRLELASPGEWFTNRTLDGDTPLGALVSQSVRRNPLVANVMALLRYIEGEGSGVPTAVRDSATIGAPEPTVRFEDGFVVVTVYPSHFDPSLVEEILHASVRAARLVSSPIGSVTCDLESMYVLQHVVPISADAAATGPGPLAATERMFSTSRRAVVVGEPGAGKSILAHALLVRLAEVGAGLPVILSARTAWELVHEQHARMEDVVRDHWESTLLVPVPEAEARELFEHTPVLLLIDGLDEVHDSVERSELVRAVEAFLAQYPQSRALVTARPGATAAVSGEDRAWSTFRLEPWSQADLVHAAQQRFGGDMQTGRDVDEVIAVVLADPALRELASNPLLGTLILDMLVRNGPALPVRYELLSWIADMLVERWDRQRGMRSFADSRTERILLGRLALRAIEEGRALSALPRDWCTATLEAFGWDLSAHTASLLDRAAARGGLLAAQRTEEGELVFRFSHRAIAEVLAGEAADALIETPAELVAFVERMSRRSAGREVAAHVLVRRGQTRNPSRALLDILAHAPELEPAHRVAVLEVVSAVLAEGVRDPVVLARFERVVEGIDPVRLTRPETSRLEVLRRRGETPDAAGE